jgi:hypothetical protein
MLDDIKFGGKNLRKKTSISMNGTCERWTRIGCGLTLPALVNKALEELSSRGEERIREFHSHSSRLPSLKENEEACRAALIHEFVRDLPQGYDTLIGGGAGIGLSSGQLQRLSIARARLLRNPTALVLGMFPLCHFYP